MDLLLQIPNDQPFMEAGLDSLGAVELRNGLSTRFNIDLPATVIFDFPTINLLAEYLGSQQSKATAAVASSSMSAEANVRLQDKFIIPASSTTGMPQGQPHDFSNLSLQEVF